MGNTGFFEPKSWGNNDIYWLLKLSCFETFGDGKHAFFCTKKMMEIWLFRDGKYGLFWIKNLMERQYLLITENFLFWTFRWWEMRSFLFSQEVDGKKSIYLVFLSFPWYCRTWEIWLCIVPATKAGKNLIQLFLYPFRIFMFVEKNK